MDLANVVGLASHQPEHISVESIDHHKAQFKLAVDTAEINMSQKNYDRAERELIRAFMERIHLDKVDSPYMLEILKMLSTVFSSNKCDDLAVISQDLFVKLEGRLKETVVESHFFIEVLFAIADGLFDLRKTGLVHDIINFLTLKLKDIEGEDAYMLGTFHSTNGEAYRHDGLFAEAISSHEQALAVWKTADEKPDNDPKRTELIKRDQAATLLCLGGCHRSSMQYIKAEERYQEALQLFQELSSLDPLVGQSHNDLAELLRDMKKFEKSVHHHLAAVDVFTRCFSPDHPQVINAKGNYGVTLNHQSRHSHELGSALLNEAVSYLIANKYSGDHDLMVKFRAEVTAQHALNEIETYKTRIKKLQTEQVLQEIDGRLQVKKYEQLEQQLKRQESEHKSELNKIKFMNSVLTEQVNLNKSTTNNLLTENDDLLKKIGTFIAKQAQSDARNEEETKKMQDIFDELLIKTEELEASDVLSKKEEARLLEEIDLLAGRDEERLAEIENLRGQVWTLEKHLKVEAYKSSQLQLEVEQAQKERAAEAVAAQAAVEVPVALSCGTTQTNLVPVGEVGHLERTAHSLAEDAVTAALQTIETIGIEKGKRSQPKALYIPNDSEEFVRHQYPIYDDEIASPSAAELKTAADESKIHDLSIALTMEEVLSATAFSCLDNTKKSMEAEAAECALANRAAMEELSASLSSLDEKYQSSQEVNRVNQEELKVLRDFMKEHDLDPKKTKLKALKAKVHHLEEETSGLKHKVHELDTELFMLKVEHEGIVRENELNSRTAVEVTDTNHLLTLQLKAANYEIEHMSAELHLDRHKMNELRVSLDGRAKELTQCEGNCKYLEDTVKNRDATIVRLENELAAVRGVPQKNRNQFDGELTGDVVEEGKDKVDDGKEEEEAEGEEDTQKDSPAPSFLTDLVVEELAPPPLEPARAPFLPALEGTPKPDDKSTVEGSPAGTRSSFLKPIDRTETAGSRVSFLEPLDRSDSVDDFCPADFAEVLFVGAPKPPKNAAALKMAQHTKNKDKNLKRLKHYCTMCDHKFKGTPKVIPTSLQNVLQPGQSFDDLHKSEEGSAKEFQLAGFPRSSKNYLDSQVIWRESYSTRGEDCIFCCWDCARDWNKKNTPVNYRYTTQKLIDIAAGKFIS